MVVLPDSQWLNAPSCLELPPPGQTTCDQRARGLASHCLYIYVWHIRKPWTFWTLCRHDGPRWRPIAVMMPGCYCYEATTPLLIDVRDSCGTEARFSFWISGAEIVKLSRVPDPFHDRCWGNTERHVLSTSDDINWWQANPAWPHGKGWNLTV